MASRTAAQEEFDAIVAKASSSSSSAQHNNSSSSNSRGHNHHHHKDDRDSGDDSNHDEDEEEEYRQRRIDETMRMPTFDRSNGGGAGGSIALRLPHRDFDRGRTTGVKGVIADARSYEEARRWRNKSSSGVSPSGGGGGGGSTTRAAAENRASTFLKDDGEGSDDEDEEFLERWRQQRRMELEHEEGSDIRNRRTSPSSRRYGRLDVVDAMGYLDAIEKVGRETVVVVFVYDDECSVSQIISDALTPLVPLHPTVRFVKVHYEDIEFDNAGVPAILAYKNQGDLFANLTYIVDQIPDDDSFGTPALETILRKHQVL